MPNTEPGAQGQVGARLYRVRPTRRSLRAEDVELAFVMYQEGRLAVYEIASEMGVCAGTLGIYLREYRAAVGGMDFLRSLDSISGRRGRPPTWLASTDERRELVVKMHAEGLGIAEMARRTGVQPSTINHDLRVLGLWRRQRPAARDLEAIGRE
jgi:transposase-like protein